ncbi:hypothetical protein V6R21_14475 [Limibacter armeniacum]|uniref:hypothetical protein n=1 Tax=Limibacter armeniacum TaxID=466084 RepID=UPI002FE5B1C8
MLFSLNCQKWILGFVTILTTFSCSPIGLENRNDIDENTEFEQILLLPNSTQHLGGLPSTNSTVGAEDAKSMVMEPDGEVSSSLQFAVNEPTAEGIYISVSGTGTYYMVPVEAFDSGIMEFPIGVMKNVSGGVLEIEYKVYGSNGEVGTPESLLIGVDAPSREVSCGESVQVEDLINSITTSKEKELQQLDTLLDDGILTYSDYCAQTEKILFKLMMELKTLGTSCSELTDSEIFQLKLQEYELEWESYKLCPDTVSGFSKVEKPVETDSY